jgi:alpha-N-acetylglucosamine transferase
MRANAPFMTPTILRKTILALGFLFLLSFTCTSTGTNPTLRSNLDLHHEPSHGAEKRENIAYVTYLAQSDPEPEEDRDDKYFIATRMLGYQLMHAPDTRTNTSIPFIVMVPTSMRQSKRDRLVRDGAIVIEVQDVEPRRWMDNITAPRYRNQFTKLRVFEMEEWDRILYIDSDMLVTQRLHTIFDSAEATGLQYNRNQTIQVKQLVCSTIETRLYR